MILLQAYGSRGMEWGSLNVIVPHKSMTIRRYVLFGVGVSLLKSVCHCEVGL